jgi:hypothetical protein
VANSSTSKHSLSKFGFISKTRLRKPKGRSDKLTSNLKNGIFFPTVFKEKSSQLNAASVPNLAASRNASVQDLVLKNKISQIEQN